MLQFEVTKRVLAKFQNVPILKRLAPSFFRRWHLLTGRQYHVSYVHGLRWLLDFQTLMDRRLAVWGEFEEEQLSFMLDQLKKKQFDLFFDIGSCAGYYAIFLKNKHPSLEVHAFEPHPHNRNQLHANLFLNNMPDDVTVHPVAVGKESGVVKIGYESTRNRGHAVVNTVDGFEVDLKPIDGIFAHKGKTSLFKIDVEGFEIDVIDGMTKYLKNNDCVLQIEAWSDKKAILMDKMESIGYECFDVITWDFYFRKQ